MTTTNSSTVSAPMHKKNDLQPELKMEMRSTKTLKRSKHHVKKTSNRQKKKCIASFERFGVCRPVLITDKGEIVDGHSTMEAAIDLGLPEIACICITHLSDEEIRGLRIALNKIQETGEWDETNLKLELAFQLEFNFDLTDLGFEPPELDTLFETLPEENCETDPLDQLSGLPQPDAPTVSHLGDIWVLDQHVIACGNMRDTKLLTTVVGEKQLDFVFADPPYNTKVNGHIRVGKSGFEEFAEASGEMTPVEFIRFLIEFLANAKAILKPGAMLFVCMDWRHEWELFEAVRVSGLEILNRCVWVKPNGGMGSLYRSRHESVFVLKVPGESHTNNVQLGSNGRNRTNVWEYSSATGGKSDPADDFSLHPTVKPVRLVEDAILDVSAVGWTVFDPFLGSGTTLLAAERTKRRCIGLEISPTYVDVAIRRWMEMTGKEAVLQATGQTFSER